MTQKSSKITASWPLVKRLIRSYMAPMKKSIAVAMVLMMISAATTGAMAKLMEPIIDKVLTAGDDKLLWPVAFTVLAVFVVRGLTSYGHTVIMSKLGQRIVSNIQMDMFKHLIHADLAFFHGLQSGQLQSRFLADMRIIRTALIEALAGIGKNVFTLVILIFVMFIQDWKLSVISLFVFPILGYVVARLGKKLRKVSKSMQEETGDLSAILGQAFQGSKHVKAYGTEEYESKRVDRIIENIYRLMYKSYKTAALGTPLAETLSGLAIVTIIVYGGYQVMAEATTAGKLFSFITAFILAFEPMKRLTRLNNALQMGLAAAERLFAMMDTPPSIRDKDGAVELVTTSPTVAFDNVSFSYGDTEAEALKKISFEAPAGKTVALVGQSGAGKTTILNLIPRFYDITGGVITIDGHDIRDVTLKSLRGSMALVSQDVALFNDTVGDNIAYGTPGASEGDIIEAAKSAAAHEFIMELPKGYDTYVGENGVKLSGGQRQRIAIARAMLRNAPILLLDEATSALDAQSERLVQTALDRLQKGRTTIVVAHRLSTIVNADIIYVLHQGQVVESGNHETLIAANGTYARLYGMMMKETA